MRERGLAFVERRLKRVDQRGSVPPNRKSARGIMEPESSGEFPEVDAYIRAQLQRLRIPGMALAVVRDGRLVHARGFGRADDTGRAVTPETVFCIGSITKSVTAVAIMQLACAGKLSLDEPVRTYVDGFRLANEPESSRITIRHLLLQSSGISTRDGNAFWGRDASLEQAVRQLSSTRLRHPVGTKWQYANTNYVILGLVIEKVSGQSYPAYVEENVFRPLGMSHSYATYEAARGDDLASGFYYVLGKPVPRSLPMPPAYVPTGLLFSTVLDMAQYLLFHLDGGRSATRGVLSAAAIEELHRPGVSIRGPARYAMGWVHLESAGAETLWHNGDAGVHHSMAILEPDAGLGVVVLANASGFEQRQQVDEVARGVRDLVLGRTPRRFEAARTLRWLYRGVMTLVPAQLVCLAASHAAQVRCSSETSCFAILTPNLALAWFLLGGLSLVVPFPPRALRVFYPELGYAAFFGGLISLGWAAICALEYLGAR